MIRFHHLNWMRDAACLEYPREWWFGDNGDKRLASARQVCRACLVRTECLTHALANKERHGIWAGFGHQDLKRWRQLILCPDCGERIPTEQVAVLAIRNALELTCRRCHYRRIAERRRT